MSRTSKPSARSFRPTASSMISRCLRRGSNGSASTGRERIPSSWRRSERTQLRRAPTARWRSSAIACCSPSTSGTTFFAASVGVAARTSATRSSTGLSGSCPIAETTGVRIRATARTSASSENGSRSSTEPPPRATMMTSTSSSASSRCSAATTSGTVFGPCTAVLITSKRTAGHRCWETLSTSRSAAEPRPVTSPIFFGKNGGADFKRGSKSPSALSARFNCSMRASSSPTPTWRTWVTHREKEPRPA